MLTDNEEKAVHALKRAWSKLPATLRVYVVDDGVMVCKKGVSSNDVCELIGSNAHPCAYLTDLHDDNDFGRN